MTRNDYLLRCIFIAAAALLIESCFILKTHAAENVIAIIYTEPEDPIEDEHCDFVTYEEQNPYAAIHMTEQEYAELKLIVSAEAQTEGNVGMAAVTQVILNRVLSDRFPDTVHGVLSQRGQFATWKRHSWAVPDMADEAIEAVMDNGLIVLEDTGYLYFSRGKQSYAHDHIKIGRHWFGR